MNRPLRWAAGALLAGALAGCAGVPAAAPQAGRVRLALPPGDWVDLGATDEALDRLELPASVPPLSGRAVALRGPQQELLAVLLVQANRDAARAAAQWSVACPAQYGVLVDDVAQASPVRTDCLRWRPDADLRGWLQREQPALAGWLAQHQAMPASRPYVWLNYRYATEGGAYVAVQAVVDQRLLRPVTRSNMEFLVAGEPARDWSRQLAQAARASTGLLDGALAVPPFPLPLPN